MATKEAKTFYFLKELYPIAEKNLKTKNSTLLNEITHFIDRNSEILYSKSPDKRLYFKDIPDRNIIFKSIGITDKEIKNTIRKCDCIDSKWNITNNPFNFAILLPLRYYMLNKNKRGIEAIITYFNLSFYSSTQSNYFKFPPNPAIMEYTINNMNNKFLLKKIGNMFGTILHTGMTCYENFYDDLLKEFDDYTLVKFINSTKDRQNHLMSNIFKEYKKNQESGKYLNMEKDSFDEDNYYEVENTSSIINNLANATSLKINSKAGLNDRLIKLAAGMAGVSKNAVRNAIINIIENNGLEVKEIFNLILELYLEGPKNKAENIGSQQFVNFCWELYIKSNTLDKNIKRIKEILDIWLTSNSSEYLKTERVATKNNFRKAIYLYMVLMLQQTYIHR